MKIAVSILSVLIVVAVISMIFKNNRIPEDLGVKNSKLAPMPTSPNAVSSQSDDPKYQVAPLPMKENLATTKEAILKSAETWGRENGSYEIAVQQEKYFHIIFITPTMRFKDDAEFYIDQEAGIVHFRSASRVGYGDMGLNRKRYDEISSIYSDL